MASVKPSPKETPWIEHFLNSIMFWVKVPVLSEKTYSIWPKSSEMFQVLGTQGVSSIVASASDCKSRVQQLTRSVIHLHVLEDEEGLDLAIL
jgi:hypothetical protein